MWPDGPTIVAEDFEAAVARAAGAAGAAGAADRKVAKALQSATRENSSIERFPREKPDHHVEDASNRQAGCWGSDVSSHYPSLHPEMR